MIKLDNLEFFFFFTKLGECECKYTPVAEPPGNGQVSKRPFSHSESNVNITERKKRGWGSIIEITTFLHEYNFNFLISLSGGTFVPAHVCVLCLAHGMSK